MVSQVGIWEQVIQYCRYRNTDTAETKEVEVSAKIRFDEISTVDMYLDDDLMLVPGRTSIVTIDGLQYDVNRSMKDMIRFANGNEDILSGKPAVENPVRLKQFKGIRTVGDDETGYRNVTSPILMSLDDITAIRDYICPFECVALPDKCSVLKNNTFIIDLDHPSSDIYHHLNGGSLS